MKSDTKPVKNRVIKMDIPKPKSKVRQLQAEYSNVVIKAKRVASASTKTTSTKKSTTETTDVSDKNYRNMHTESVSQKYFPKQDYFYTDNKQELWHDHKVTLEKEKKIFFRKEKSTDKFKNDTFNKVIMIKHTNILIY